MMRNYRLIGRNNNMLLALGSGASQIRPKRIVVTEYLPNIIDASQVVLKGTFIFEDSALTFSDSLIINKTTFDHVEFLDENFILSDNVTISKNDSNGELNENIDLINDFLVILKEEE